MDDIEAQLEAGIAEVGELAHANPKRRRDALDRLIERKERVAIGAVLRRLDVEDNPYVLSRLLTATGVLGAAPRAEAAAVRFVAHADPRVAANALDALRALGAKGGVAAARGLLDSPQPRVRANAIVYLAAVERGFDVRPPLEAMLSSARPAMLASALWALEAARVDAPLELARMAAGSTDPEVLGRVRRIAARLADAGDEDARALIHEIESGEATGGEALKLAAPALPKRVWAWLADSVVLGALAFSVMVAITMATLPSGRLEDNVRTGLQLATRFQFVLLLYSVVFFVRDGFGGGRGLAKRYLGLRVVDLETRSGCGYLKSMLRQATFYLPLVNIAELVWASYDPQGRRLIDHVLGTMVIDEKQRALTRLDRWLLGFFIAVFLGTVVASLGFSRVLRLVLGWLIQ